MSKRTEWIDICKALAIYCMVLGHVGTAKPISEFIHVFHMPVFFLLSGYCFNEVKNSNIGQLISKRFKSLLVPYFIFGTGLFLFWDFALFILHRRSEMRSITNLATSMLWDCASASAFGVIQWFLPCLFFAELLFALLIKVSGKNRKYTGGGISILYIIGYSLPHVLGVRLPLAIDCAVMASVFFGIGWLIKGSTSFTNTINTIKRSPIISTIICLIGASAAYPLTVINGEVNMRVLKYGNFFLFIILALAYSFALIVVSVVLNRKKNVSKLLSWIGRNTLVILLLNSTCVRVYEVVCGGIVGKMESGMVWMINALVAVLIVLVCTVLSEITNKYLPWLLGKHYK